MPVGHNLGDFLCNDLNSRVVPYLNIFRRCYFLHPLWPLVAGTARKGVDAPPPIAQSPQFHGDSGREKDLLSIPGIMGDVGLLHRNVTLKNPQISELG